MSITLEEDLEAIHSFLTLQTPKEWLIYAAQNIPTLLLDHAHCERKASATALNFISKYPERKELVEIMSPLAREELLHFEKVLGLMAERSISYAALHPSDYASTMHRNVTQFNCLERLCDQLIIGAIIEARSCERFHALIPYLEDEVLVKFYSSLVKAEARHFEDYLRIARLYGGSITEERINKFIKLENEFIQAKDSVFRFHSGIPNFNAGNLDHKHFLVRNPNIPT